MRVRRSLARPRIGWRSALRCDTRSSSSSERVRDLLLTEMLVLAGAAREQIAQARLSGALPSGRAGHARVLLVGGGAMTPGLRDTLEAELDLAVIADEEPATAVARGALLASGRAGVREPKRRASGPAGRVRSPRDLADAAHRPGGRRRRRDDRRRCRGRRAPRLTSPGRAPRCRRSRPGRARRRRRTGHRRDRRGGLRHRLECVGSCGLHRRSAPDHCDRAAAAGRRMQ